MTSTGTSLFSSDGATAVQTRLEVETRNPSADVDSDYDLESCARWISDGAYQRVALQFPDSLLVDAVAISSILEKRTGARIFILGDTSYGSCCVDEIAAAHCNADSLIHFGTACLSPTMQRLPVRFVFQHHFIDVKHCCTCVSDLVATDVGRDVPLVLVYDVEFSHASVAICSALMLRFGSVIHSQLVMDGKEEAAVSGNDFLVVLSRRFALPGGRSAVAGCAFVFVGEEDSSVLSGLLLRWGSASVGVYHYSPATRSCRREGGGIHPLSRQLAKRYHMVEKAKDAQIVGIVVGTLGVDGYLDVIARLKSLIKEAGKKCYTFVVGKLNTAKLANFMEIDVFVLVACPQNSLLNSSEFYRPIVTPYEMEIACNPQRPWSSEYITDYRALLPGGDSHVPAPEHIEVTADVSLVTGRMRNIGVATDENGDERGSDSLAVAKRADGTLAAVTATARSAGEFLQLRTWHGLEQSLGETEVVKAAVGMSGIACGYGGEPTSAKPS